MESSLPSRASRRLGARRIAYLRATLIQELTHAVHAGTVVYPEPRLFPVEHAMRPLFTAPSLLVLWLALLWVAVENWDDQRDLLAEAVQLLRSTPEAS